MSYPSTPEPDSLSPACYRHPDRTTYVRCNRCQRYICPECMTAASVGHQCPDCVRQGAASVRAPRTQFGGTLRTDTRPWVTWTLIAVNIVMYLLQMMSSQVERALWLWPPAVAFGDEYYRLVTSAFLHGSVTHILFNMWALYVVGPPLEAVLGRLRFGVLYALSGLGGSVAVYWLSALRVADTGCIGGDLRPVRRHLRGGTSAQPRRQMGAGADRAQPGAHLRRAGRRHRTDQLAGASRRVDHRRAGRGGVRLRAERAPQRRSRFR